jgi:endonuclease YncB( thermonuclease family)
LVVNIQDSHTLDVLIDGQPANRIFTIRLLGVEPPLLSDPWANVAVEWLAKELSRQIVVLESGAVERDPQGNLLRYVWRERRMVNVTLVQLGLATASEDVAGLRYSADLLAAQADAQAAGRGLWGPPPTATPAATPVVPLTAITATVTITVTQTPTATLSPTFTPTP